MSQTRRDVLRRLGTAASVGTLTVAAAGPAAGMHVASVPEHVTITYDADVLETYRPRLVMSDTTRDLYLGTYSWLVSSEKHDTDVAVYWQSYIGQDGVTSYDSHWGDHEPIYCWIGDDGLQKVAASIYHWLKGAVPAATIPTSGGTHPVCRVISPWHHHTAGTLGRGRLADLHALGTGEALRDPDRTTVFEAWLANGLEESLGVNTVTEPWVMEQRSHWWRRDAGPISTTAFLVQARQLAGLGVTGSLDPDG